MNFASTTCKSPTGAVISVSIEPVRRSSAKQRIVRIGGTSTIATTDDDGNFRVEVSGLAGKFQILLFTLSFGELVPSLILSGIFLIVLGILVATLFNHAFAGAVGLLSPLFYKAVTRAIALKWPQLADKASADL